MMNSVSPVPYSAVVTTFNNAATLERCLRSVGEAAELLVLDSGSDDATVAIAQSCGARVAVQAFRGYGAQKQAAVDLAQHDWVLLLDADEALSPALAIEIDALMQQGPDAQAYRLRRREQLFWRWQRRGTKLIQAVRLFQRQRCRLSALAVHAAVETDGRVGQLRGELLHYGEVDVHSKVARINAYSSGMVQDRLRRCQGGVAWRLLLYPCVAFWREYLLRRQFLNGWAGLIAARTSAFYAFLKYAKVYDAKQPRAADLLDRRAQHYCPPGVGSEDTENKV